MTRLAMAEASRWRADANDAAAVACAAMLGRGLRGVRWQMWMACTQVYVLETVLAFKLQKCRAAGFIC
jgi:hypothetical protein